MGLPEAAAAAWRGDGGGEDHEGGPPSGLDAAGRAVAPGRAPRARLDDVPRASAWVCSRRRWHRRRRNTADAATRAPGSLHGAVVATGRGFSSCDGCSPRAVRPCQLTSGSAACGPRQVSVSGRTKNESSDSDADRRVEPRPVRAVPLGASAALRRSPDALSPGAGRPRRRPRLRDGRSHQDPAPGDGGEGDGRHRLLAGHAGPRRRPSHGDVPGLSFVQGDIATWLDEGVDLVFANASLQWIDDHLNLLARMRTALAPDGQLAFQVPANFRHPSHVLAHARGQRDAVHRRARRRVPEDRGRFVLSPELYADLLYELGAKDQVVRMEVYGHELESTGEVVEWVMGTPAHAVSQAPEPGALRGVHRALPGAADRGAGGAGAVLLRVPAHPLLGALQLSGGSDP